MSLSRLAQRICHRNTGVGADGLIAVRTVPALEMLFFNQDGSSAPMCGNGIRCFAKYCLDSGIKSEKEYPVKTGVGTMHIRIVSTEPFLACVGMGKPIFLPGAFGVQSEESDFLSQNLRTSCGEVTVSSCFMGTVHTVLFVDDLKAVAVETLGKEIEGHPVFTEKTNVNFVEVIDDSTLRLVTYERGVGRTNACGTGACASLVIGARLLKCGRTADVLLPLGKLHVEQNDQEEVTMTGPAEKICEGTVEIGGVL